MGSLSIWHWVIVLAIIIILFGGKGKLSGIMGDLGKGIKSFKKEVGADETPENQPHSIINQDSSNPESVTTDANVAQNSELQKEEEKKENNPQ